MSGDEARLNPQIREVTIGVRNLRNIKIYPMSMADQTRFIKLIEEVLNTYFAQLKGEEELSADKLPAFIMSLTDVVGKNIKDLMNIVIDPEEISADDFFNDTTNTQMSEIVTHIVQDNFEEPSKNVMGLVKTFKNMFQLTRPSQQSLNDMLNIDSEISTEEVSEKED